MSLTVSIGSTTRIYQPNASGEFLVVLDWVDTQEVTLTLSSALAPGESYAFSVTLAAGIENKTETEPGTGSIGKTLIDTATTATLTIAADTSPSVKITGSTHLVKLGEDDTLTVTIEMENVDGTRYTMSAIIQKKAGEEYIGNLGSKYSQTDNQYSYSLNAIADKGSYCLFITISDNSSGSNVTVLQVPYYFIVD